MFVVLIGVSGRIKGRVRSLEVIEVRECYWGVG